MTASGKSYQERAAIDPVLTVNYIHAVRDAYARDQDWSDFRLSPLFGDLKDFPPTLIQAGSSELLLSRLPTACGTGWCRPRCLAGWRCGRISGMYSRCSP